QSVVWGVYCLVRAGLRLFALLDSGVGGFVVISIVTGTPFLVALGAWGVWHARRSFGKLDLATVAAWGSFGAHSCKWTTGRCATPGLPSSHVHSTAARRRGARDARVPRTPSAARRLRARARARPLRSRARGRRGASRTMAQPGAGDRARA